MTYMTDAQRLAHALTTQSRVGNVEPALAYTIAELLGIAIDDAELLRPAHPKLPAVQRYFVGDEVVEYAPRRREPATVRSRADYDAGQARGRLIAGAVRDIDRMTTPTENL